MSAETAYLVWSAHLLVLAQHTPMLGPTQHQIQIISNCMYPEPVDEVIAGQQVVD